MGILQLQYKYESWETWQGKNVLLLLLLYAQKLYTCLHTHTCTQNTVHVPKVNSFWVHGRPNTYQMIQHIWLAALYMLHFVKSDSLPDPQSAAVQRIGELCGLKKDNCMLNTYRTLLVHCLALAPKRDVNVNGSYVHDFYAMCLSFGCHVMSLSIYLST